MQDILHGDMPFAERTRHTLFRICTPSSYPGWYFSQFRILGQFVVGRGVKIKQNLIVIISYVEIIRKAINKHLNKATFSNDVVDLSPPFKNQLRHIHS